MLSRNKLHQPKVEIIREPGLLLIVGEEQAKEFMTNLSLIGRIANLSNNIKSLNVSGSLRVCDTLLRGASIVREIEQFASSFDVKQSGVTSTGNKSNRDPSETQSLYWRTRL